MKSASFRSLFWLVHREGGWSVLSQSGVGHEYERSRRAFSTMRRDFLTAWVKRYLEHYPERRWFP